MEFGARPLKRIVQSQVETLLASTLGDGVENEEKGVGAGHHNQEFDIDEDVLYKGAAAAATYAIEYLKDNSLKGGRKMTYKQYLEKVGNHKQLAKHYGE